MKEEKLLMEKKDKLFKTQNIKKWQYTGNEIELLGRKEALLADKKKAFPFILSEETKKLKERQEMTFFYTNSLLSELRRVGEDNGRAMVEHFLGASEV